MPSIALIDDEALIRNGIKSMIRRMMDGWSVIGEAATAEEGLKLLESENPDVAIVDVRMPGQSGLEMIESALSRGLRTVYVILSGHADFHYVQRALRLGVSDYLLKPVKRDDFKELMARLETRINDKPHEVLYRNMEKFKKERSLLLLEKQLVQLLQGKLHASEINPEWFTPFGYHYEDQKAILIRLEMNSESLVSRIKSIRDEQLFTLFCLQVMDEYIQTSAKGLAILDPESVPVAILFSHLEDELFYREAVKVGEEIQQFVQMHAHFKLNIGVSMPIHRVEHLHDAYQQAINDGKNQNKNRPIQTVLHYIHQNYQNNITLTDAAKLVFLHPTYLSEMFRKKTGINFSEYVNRLRMEETKKLLKETNQSIQDIAEKTGYQSYRHFNRVFRRINGISPSLYRKKGRP